MFSEWRKRSKVMQPINTIMWLGGNVKGGYAYRVARAAFKAGVRAGIKQERERAKK